MKSFRAGLALLLLLTACGRKESSEVVSPPASLAAAPLAPWSWHPVGSLAVDRQRTMLAYIEALRSELSTYR